MVESAVGVFSPTSLGSGEYSFSLFFETGSEARYLRVGDQVTDANSNTYQISTWNGFPSDFTSGATVTTTFVTADVLPNQDAGFDSVAFTPNQQDLRPVFRSSGSIGNISLFSGQSFEYTVSAAWNDLSAVANAVVGDYIVDAVGNYYEITFLGATRFNEPFRMKEVDEVGETPIDGIATIFRPTSNFQFFQGTELSDPARNNAFIRDKVLIDQNLGAGGSGSGETAESAFTNSSGASLDALTPVDVAGNTINVSLEASVDALAGLTKAAVSDAAAGVVVHSGRITNVTTGFADNDAVYISKTGTLTNEKPSIGVASFVADDFVVRVGKVVDNNDNPSNQDLIVDIQIIGQL